MFDFSQLEWLSFDCYGTLIDWESGILSYLRPLLNRKGCNADDASILNFYSEFEPRRQSGPYRNYREVLAGVVRDLARVLNFNVTTAEAAGLAESVASWEPFADSVAGLRRLQTRYKLAILSNIDDDLFAFSAARLKVSFDCVLTAQQLQSYKPALRNFEALLQRLAVPRSGVLHVAESLFHDVAPAQSLGIATVWVNRRQGRVSAASKLAAVTPDLEVRDMLQLAEIAVM
jgi:2-haloacid dehalogenase